MLNGEVLHRFKSDDVANTGVNALAFAATLDAFRERRHADEPATTSAACRSGSRRKGLYAGPRDGTLRRRAARRPIEGFERAARACR